MLACQLVAPKQETEYAFDNHLLRLSGKRVIDDCREENRRRFLEPISDETPSFCERAFCSGNHLFAGWSGIAIKDTPAFSEE